MKLKPLRKRSAATAARITVRAARPWWMLALPWLFAGALGAGVAVWAYDRGARLAGFDRSSASADAIRLEAEASGLRKERDELAANLAAATSDLAIERAAQERLLGQVKTLEAENVRLKQDLAFFDRILPQGAGQGVAIRSFQVERDVGGERLHYRVLVSQPAKVARDFVGQVQFVLNGVHNGRGTQITIPERFDPDDRTFALSFRMFQRVEGVLDVPAGVSVRSVQLRILENGTLRTQQTTSVG